MKNKKLSCILFPVLAFFQVSCAKKENIEKAQFIEVQFHLKGVSQSPDQYLIEMSWPSQTEYSNIHLEKSVNEAVFSKLETKTPNFYSESFKALDQIKIRLIGTLNDKKYLLFQQELLIPKDLVVENETLLETNILSPNSRIFFKDNSTLKTNGKDFLLDVAEIYVGQNAKIDTLPFGIANIGEEGKSGGSLFIKTKLLNGTLHIFSRGQNGGQGSKGQQGSFGRAGVDGRDATSLCAQRPDESSTPGQNGENGGSGAEGAQGKRGGHSALIRLEIADILNGELNLFEEPGMGGPGGEGGEGGEGGQAGKGGQGYPNNRGGPACHPKSNGALGLKGPQGARGLPGPDGARSSYCILLQSIQIQGNCEEITKDKFKTL